jgi:hypothetical protein
MIKLLKKYLFRLTLPQEYICVAYEMLAKPMKTFVENTNGSLRAISENQIMIGYKPLLIGLKADQIKNGKNISLNEKVILHLGINKDDIIAKLWMKVNQIKKLNSQSVVLLEGVKGKEKFKNIMQNVLHNSYYKLNVDKEENIYLKGNL